MLFPMSCPPDHLPGRVLGLDLGTKTIGLALSDPGRRIASAFGVIRRQGMERDLDRLAGVIEERAVAEIALGLPLHLSGAESEGSRRSREFAKALTKRFGLPVHLMDESLTTKDAEAVLLAADLSRRKRKKVVDGLAAAFILQSYLNESAEQASNRGQE